MIAVIADNQDITRYGLLSLIASDRLFSECKEVFDKQGLLSILSDSSDAVVILDYTLFDISTEYLQVVHERFRRVKWILFSDHLSEDFMRRMLGNKSFSLVLKDAPLREIKEAIRSAVSGGQYICPAVMNIFDKEKVQEEKFSPLTATEREILKCLALGKTTKEIAFKRCLSIHTVMTHRKNIFRKIGVNNVYEATKYALRAGIVDAAEYYI